ncbi:hypothetical protein DPSP01_000295 [Paraphaeosphaeria sporulosa]
MFAKRKPTDTTAHVRPAKRKSVVADSVADDASGRGAMSDNPMAEGDKPTVIDLKMDEEMSDLPTAGAEKSSDSGHSPAGSARQPSLDTRIDGTQPSLMPRDSQSPFASESRILDSEAQISPAAQPDVSSTNTWRGDMVTVATSLNQLTGNIPHSSTSPPRPSAGPLVPRPQLVGPYGTGLAGLSQSFGFQAQFLDFVDSSGHGLFGRPEAQAHVAAERQLILQAFQEPPSTPSGRHSQQQRGSVTTPNISPPPMHRSRNKQCCSSPALSLAQRGGLVYCQNCHCATKEDTEISDASFSTSSSSSSSETLVQCCFNPNPFDISEEDDITGPNIVCLNCHTPHDAADIFAPNTQSKAAKYLVSESSSSVFLRGRAVSLDRSTAIEDKGEDDIKHLGSMNVKEDLDPNRIRMVKYIKSEPGEIPRPYKPVPTVYRQSFGEALFSQCYDAEKSFCPAPFFQKFMELPRELRERVYGFALKSDKPIAPHLCDAGRPASEGKADYGKAIRFHDENQTAHNATCKLLTITRVSKQVREESLPIFYGVNTFQANGDTPTYFFRLQQLGRFHMIRHVDFWVRFWKNDQYPQKHMRMLLQNIEEQKAFEINHRQARQNERSNKAKAATPAKITAAKGRLSKVPNVSEDTKFYTDDVDVLKSHPLHLMGGLEAHFSSSFLVLRMLSAQFQDSEYNRQLVIHVPTTTLFEQYNSLKYFPSVCEGLGIQLKLISGRHVEFYGSSFRLSWAQKYQKKDFTASTTAKDWDEAEALTQRVQALYPNIEELKRPAKWTYMRRLCKQNEIEWFSIKTAGGGIR